MDGKEHMRRIDIGINKELFDAELYGIDQALDFALRAEKPRVRYSSVSTQLALTKLKKVEYLVRFTSRFASNKRPQTKSCTADGAQDSRKNHNSIRT